MTDSRELLTKWEEFRTNDGARYIMIKSIEHQDYPVTNDWLRGEVYHCGIILTPSGEQTKFTYLEETSFKGNAS